MLLGTLHINVALFQCRKKLVTAAVKARQFLGIQLDGDIVNIQSSDRGQTVFRGFHVDLAAAERSAAVTLDNIFGADLN